MDGQTNKSSRLLSIIHYPDLSFFSSFLLHSFPRSEQRCPYPASWEGGVRACACVCVCAEQEQAWQVQCTVRQYGAPQGKTGWERSPCLRQPEVKADA